MLQFQHNNIELIILCNILYFGKNVLRYFAVVSLLSRSPLTHSHVSHISCMSDPGELRSQAAPCLSVRDDEAFLRSSICRVA